LPAALHTGNSQKRAISHTTDTRIPIDATSIIVYIYSYMCIYSFSRIPRAWSVATGLVAVLLGAGPLVGQSRTSAPAPADILRLSAALQEADGHAFPNRVAQATAQSERARARLPLKALLPSARIETGVIRTTDPIAAFGTTLRQRRVTPEAFNPALLNNPDAITNVQGGVVLEVPLLNADAVAGIRAARAGADAASAASDWTTINTRANVVRAFYGAVYATEASTTLQQASVAAEAATRQVEAMVRQGLVTRADALQAEVRAADVASQLFAARDGALTATRQLGVLLGRSNSESILLPASLPTNASVRAIAVRDTLAGADTRVGTRADARAARAGLVAATADKSRAVSTLLPRLNSFARYDWNAASVPFSGRKNWTVGLMASWSLFSGGSELADVAAATARVAGARAGEDAVLAQGRMEADAARRGIIVGLQRLDLAERAAGASREAYRLVDKRYAGGLATIAELLSAESSATTAALGQATARYALIDAMTTYRRAIGADPAELSELDKEQ